jgi:hypothetical protein
MLDSRINDMFNKYNYNELYLRNAIKYHLEIITELNHNIWKDDHQIYYKTKNGNIIYGTKEQISDIAGDDIKKDILIIDGIESQNIHSIGKYGLYYRYLLLNLIPYKMFNPFTKIEAYYDFSRKKHFANTFRYSEYLEFRLGHENFNYHIDIHNSQKLSNSFIGKFIYHLVADKIDYYTVIYWLSGFFKTLTKSKYALMMIGDKEVSEEIFLKEIIQPIFGSNFCVTLTDNILQNKSINQIIEDKIFYHIGIIKHFSLISKKVQDAIKVIIGNNMHQNDTDYVYGQTLITYKKDNQHVIKNIRDNVKIIKINKFETILKELNCNKAYFYRELEKDLSNFSHSLFELKLNNELFHSHTNHPHLNVSVEPSYQVANEYRY